MDNFPSLVSPDFASTTGVTAQAIAAAATSTMQVYIGGFLAFLWNNTSSMIAYGMIAVILLVAVGMAFGVYSFFRS